MVTSGENRKRKQSKKSRETRTLWAFLFRKDSEENDINRGSFFNKQDEDDVVPPDEAPPRNFLQEIWHRFNMWTLVAILLFLAFAGVLATAVCYMWIPQDLRDISGYEDKAGARDLTALIRNADGSQVSFSESELNRYLRATCRMRQTGFFSIFAHAQGVAVRIHDGYAELIIDRVVGVNMHQTTAINIAFTQVQENGRPVLKVDFQGGESILGDVPKGGSIGRLSVPKRYIQVLKPALETLMDCYPDITEAINTHGYLPILTKGKNGQEGRVTLIPFSPTT